MYIAKIALVTLVVGVIALVLAGPVFGLAGAILCCVLMFGWLSLLATFGKKS